MRHKANSKLTTIIATDTEFEGHIVSKEGVRLDGILRGTLKTEGDVHIGESGLVVGNLTAANVYISGEINGDICAEGKVCILYNGKVTGDVKSQGFTVDDEAYFQGNCVMEVRHEMKADKRGKRLERRRALPNEAQAETQPELMALQISERPEESLSGQGLGGQPEIPYEINIVPTDD